MFVYIMFASSVVYTMGFVLAGLFFFFLKACVFLLRSTYSLFWGDLKQITYFTHENTHERRHKKPHAQLVTVDHSARGTMKNAAKCGNRLPRRFWLTTDVSNAHCAHASVA